MIAASEVLRDAVGMSNAAATKPSGQFRLGVIEPSPLTVGREAKMLR